MENRALAARFHALHRQSTPLVLYNVWDAGSAHEVEAAGAKAIATGSWSVARAQGFEDGQQIPLESLIRIAGRIVKGTKLPVSVDFEGGYAAEPRVLRETTSELLDTGAVGVNFEDQRIGSDGLFEASDQARRIEAVRSAGATAGIELFINARTDIFLKNTAAAHAALADEAIARGKTYRDAGASGFFVPGLVDPALIQRICAEVDLPVNVMVSDKAPARSQLAELGVARLSYGPAPYRFLMQAFREAAANAFAT